MNARWGLVAVLALGGCSGGLYDVPLPGGADLGDHPYRITAEFADVLDLVPQAGVKTADVAIGRVERVELAQDNRTALVTVALNGDVRLPANASAHLRQSSLLGEKYVELGAPTGEPGQGVLGEGAVIPISRTNRNPEIEEVLGALSLLLNGGGIGQLRGIVQELNAAMSGKEPQIRSFLSTMDTFVGNLDGQKDSITRAIDGLNRLSGTLVAQTGNITTTLDDLAPGLQVITEQRVELVTMLQALDELSTVAVDTLNRSREDVVADLRALVPILQRLVEAGHDLPKAMTTIATYPFTPYAANAVKGDYFNSDVRIDLDLSNLVDNLASADRPLLPLPPLTSVPGLTAPPTATTPPVLALPGFPVVGSTVGGLAGVLEDLLGGGR
ncbi:MCE family protein [Umezawaea endophytica]|uniref:MCE family protein n=1 Tax=Umezawaea endophytica TaxID=1654476 RepID=A0A9X2ZXJ1_9PSEU|nr:MCE family protein [Umezawaea endophytica]MCS7475394.1 MCE family protein [Umezawaea endophytica]